MKREDVLTEMRSYGDRMIQRWADELEESAAADGGRGEVVAWVRFCSDGTREGPIHDSAMDDIRRNSGAWTPLYAVPPAPPAGVDGWRPISEAPSSQPDEVKLFLANGHNWASPVIAYRNDDENFCRDEHGATFDPEPTHYMGFTPLPPAPSTEAANG